MRPFLSLRPLFAGSVIDDSHPLTPLLAILAKTPHGELGDVADTDAIKLGDES